MLSPSGWGWGGSQRGLQGLSRCWDSLVKYHTLSALCLPRIQVKLGFNLHNLSQLGGLGGGENRRVETELGIETLEAGMRWGPEERRGKSLGCRLVAAREEVGPGGATGLQSSDNCQPSTVGVNLVYLSSDKKKKKVGCNLKILRLSREGGLGVGVGGGSLEFRRRQRLRRVQGSVLAELGWDREGRERLLRSISCWV